MVLPMFETLYFLLHSTPLYFHHKLQTRTGWDRGGSREGDGAGRGDELFDAGDQERTLTFDVSPLTRCHDPHTSILRTSPSSYRAVSFCNGTNAVARSPTLHQRTSISAGSATV